MIAIGWNGTIFLNCLGGSELPMVSGKDGLNVLRIINAAQKSANSGAIRICQISWCI